MSQDFLAIKYCDSDRGDEKIIDKECWQRQKLCLLYAAYCTHSKKAISLERVDLLEEKARNDYGIQICLVVGFTRP